MLFGHTHDETQRCTGTSAASERKLLPSCTICGRETVPRFSKHFDRTVVDYCHCSDCGHLTATDLEALPDYAGGRYFAEIDTGWEPRNKRMLEFIRIISRLPAIAVSRGSTILDFGCGSGSLVHDLNHARFNAFGFEPHPQSTVIAARIFATLEEAKSVVSCGADLITCIEVLEHLRDPDGMLEIISGLLRPSGYLLLSTDLYNETFHTEEWYYLNPLAGHVSIFSERSIRALLARHQFLPIFRFNGAVWLLRKGSIFRRTPTERAYFGLSQARVRLWQTAASFRAACQTPLESIK